jgi:hypothetical protein
LILGILRWLKLAFLIYAFGVVMNLITGNISFGIFGYDLIYAPFLAFGLSAIILFLEFFIPFGLSVFILYLALAIINFALDNWMNGFVYLISGMILWVLDDLTKMVMGI